MRSEAERVDHVKRGSSRPFASSRLFLSWLMICLPCAALCHYQPDLRPIPLDRPISANRIIAAGQFGGPLTPLFDVSPAQERDPQLGFREFARIINLWNAHDYSLASRKFKRFAAAYPESPWVPEALLHVGCEAYYLGRYQEARQSFLHILQLTEDLRSEGGRALQGKALTRLSNVALALGDLDGAESWLARLRNHGPTWRERVYASHWIQKISVMRSQYRKHKRCGLEALKALLCGDAQTPELKLEECTDPRGFSVAQILDMARKEGFALEAHLIQPEALKHVAFPVIVYIPPIHLQADGHFWIVESRDEDAQYHLYDPHTGRRFQQSLKQLKKQWKGLILCESSSTGPQSGERIEPEYLRDAFGGCCGIPRPEGDQGNPCERLYKFFFGAPQWSINYINLNLYVSDVPIWYDPPYGPPVRFRLSYNGLSTTSYHEPCGSKWQLNYASFLVVDPSDTVTVFMPDGRRDTYTSDGQGGYDAQKGVNNRLIKLGENHFELHLTNRRVAEYGIPSGTSSQQPLLLQIRDAYNQTIELDYDVNLNLTQVTSADGRVFTLSYDQNNLLQTISDPFGRSAQLEYDGENLVAITDMGGYQSAFAYDADVMMTSVGNTAGQTQFAWEMPDGINNDENPYPPPGGIMWENMRITVTNAQGVLGEFHYDGDSVRTWRVPFGNYIPYQDETINNLQATKVEYEPDHDDHGHDFVTQKLRLDGSDISIMEGYMIDQNNNMVMGHMITDSYSGIYFYTSNEQGYLETWGSVADQIENHTAISYAANGIDPVSVTDSRGTINLTWTPERDLESYTDRQLRTTSYTYDALGRLSTIEDPAQIVTQYDYGPDGYLSTITRDGMQLYAFEHNERGLIESLTLRDGRVLSYQYNDLNDLTRITTPEAQTVDVTYSDTFPHAVVGMDKFGMQTTYTLDNMGRITDIALPRGSSYHRVFDDAGNLTRIERDDGAATVMAYDAARRPISKTWPDGATFTIDWYDYGSKPQFRITTPRNQSMRYRLWWPLWMGRYADFELEQYDLCDGTDCFPDPDAVEDQRQIPGYPIETVMILYDEFNRPNHIMQSVYDETAAEYESREIIPTYNASNLMTGYVEPWTSTDVGFSFSPNDQLTQLSLDTQARQNFTIDYEYDALRRLESVTYGGQRMDYTYDGAFPLPATMTAQGVFSRTASYAANATLQRLQFAQLGGQNILDLKYDYDSQNRPIGETANPRPAMSIEEEEWLLTINQADQPTQTSQAFQFTTDATGNLTSWQNSLGQTVQAIYDPLNRLKKAWFTNASQTIVEHRFDYDVWGILVGHQVLEDGVLIDEKRFVNIGLLPVMEVDVERDATPGEDEYTPSALNVFGLNMGHGVGGLLLQDDLENTRTIFPLADRFGHIRAELDGDTNVLSRREYDPYGMVLAQDGQSATSFKLNTKKGFEDLGLIYYGYRFYLPECGRWLSRDPLGENAGLNLYEYCGSNPATYVDSDGRVIPVVALIGLGVTLGTTVELFCYFGPSIRDRRIAYGSNRRDDLGKFDDVWGKQKNSDKVLRDAVSEGSKKLQNYMQTPGNTDYYDIFNMSYQQTIEFLKNHPEFVEKLQLNTQQTNQ